MDIKIFIASFGLVFLAELGDKTQLTAMALTTTSKSGWMVFAGTSLALIATTALAVLFGAALTQWVPQNVLHIISAVAFILVGVILLVNVARKAPDTVPEEEAKTAAALSRAATPPGGKIIFEWIASQAVSFEDGIIALLEEVLLRVSDPQDRETVEQIIAEDRKHVESLREMEKLGRKPVVETGLAELAERDLQDTKAPALKRLSETGNGEGLRTRIEAAVEAEEKLADFYLALARKTKIHAAKDAFRWLAAEDIDHAQRLCALINPPDELAA